MKPYRQGDIDFFCAIYSIINSVRFACMKFQDFNYDNACEFYQHLMQYLYDSDGLQLVLYRGTEYDMMNELLNVADIYLRDKYRIRLLFTAPFKTRDLSLANAFLFIRKYLSRPNTSCIVRIENRVTADHWTVINKTENKFFGLFDSTGYGGMNFGKSLWSDGNTVSDKKATLINKQGIILIKCVKI